MKIISFLLLSVFLFADVLKIYSKNAKEINNTILLDKPYLIYNNELYVEANKGVVKNKNYVLLEGNVTVFYKNSVIFSDRVEIISKNNLKINDLFFYDKNLEIWFKNKIAFIKNNNLIFKNVIFSSCCVNDPDWYIFAKRGSFNKDTKYLRLYNLTLYIHKTPAFYLPFFFSSFNKKRRSGLLRPYIGFSVKEGFLYSQPIYFATSLRTDLEITPTIRTKRGRGVYNEFRFVDSPYSFGSIKAGVFYDKNSYFFSNNLAHKKHFGYQFNYKRDKVFKNDKLYIDIKYANDVDYFYLNPKNYTFNQNYLTDKIITSKINYLKNLDNSIFGVYNRYFIDTSLLSNKDTIQILPQINYHIFEKRRYNLLTSFDYNFYNYYSESKKYFVNTFLLPIGLNFKYSFINYKISEIFKGEYGNFYNSKLPPNYYFDTYTQFKIYSSFTKNDKFLHILSPSVTINLKNYNKSKITSDIISNLSIQNSISFDLFEIFQKDDFYLDHTFHQFMNFESSKNENMENQINFTYKNLSIKENNKFDWNLKRSIYNAFSFIFNISKNKIYLTHIYQYDPKLKSIDIRYERAFTQYKNLYFEYNYDIVNKYPKFWLAGINLNKKCWQYDIGFKKSLTPVLKNNGISYNVDYILNISVNFYPIGGLKQYILFK